MVRKIVDKTFTGEKHYVELFGLSTDDKPTAGIITGSKFTEVGTGIEYRFDEESRTWTPQNSGNGKTSIIGATVTLGADVQYDGTEKTKAVSTVKIGSTTLTENTDYIVKDNTGTEIGSYVLYIVGIGSYAGAIAEPWTIGKGTGSVSASPDSLSLTAGGDDGTSELTVTGDGEVTAESSNEEIVTVSVTGTTVTVTPIAEGSATITVTLAASDHYTGDTDTIAVTVAEAGEG